MSGLETAAIAIQIVEELLPVIEELLANAPLRTPASPAARERLERIKGLLEKAGRTA